MPDLTLPSVIEEFFEGQLVCAVRAGMDMSVVIIVTSLPIIPEKEREFYVALQTVSLAAPRIEIVYQEDLKMSLNGYGFIKRDGCILTEQISPSKKNVFNAYRQMLAYFGAPSQLMCGSKNDYKAFVRRAQMTAVSIVVTTCKDHVFELSGFSQKLINNGNGFLNLSDTKASETYIKQSYWPIIVRLGETASLMKDNNTFRVLNADAFELPYVKDYQHVSLEEQYLGAHESTDSWNEFMHQIASAGLQAYQTERPLDYQTPNELKSHVDTTLPVQGMASVDALIDDMSKLVNQYSINQSTVNFMAFPESGNSKAAVAASMLVPLWNQNLISVDKSAPIGTFIEVQVIEWLRQIVGYDCAPTVSAENIGGVATTGGVMSNTVGLLVARSLVFPESRMKGLTGSTKKPFLLIADKTLEHYSHKAAFWWLGLGEANVIPVKSDGFNFDIEDLRSKIAIYNSDDNVVVAVVCMAGDSRTMTVQNIDEIYAETSKHDIWLHIDACQGGVGLFASNRDELCRDYRLADSISIDPHKGLAIPYSSSFCLFKDQGVLQNISKSTDITIAKGSYDIGQVTPFLGSRPFDTLKFWALIKYHGLEGLRQNVDYRIELTKQWAQYLNQSDFFVSLNDPELTAISFSVDPRKLGTRDVDAKQLGAINKELHDRCYKAGWLIVHGFDLIDYENRLGLSEQAPLRVLGTNFGNVLLDKNHFPKIVAYMNAQLQDILRQYEQHETSHVQLAVP
jgi:L-2,4-diaminobutyrate decarboxylase